MNFHMSDRDDDLPLAGHCTDLKHKFRLVAVESATKGSCGNSSAFGDVDLSSDQASPKLIQSSGTRVC